MSRSWRNGSTPAWRRVRLLVLRRDKYRCRLQLPPSVTNGVRIVCGVDADCVHHVLGRAVTGDNPRYLVAACTPCNLRVGEPAAHTPTPRRVTRW